MGSTRACSMKWQHRSLLKNSNNSFCGGANALTSLRLHHRSLRICSVGAPRHCIRRARNLNRRNFSTNSYAPRRLSEVHTGISGGLKLWRTCAHRSGPGRKRGPQRSAPKSRKRPYDTLKRRTCWNAKVIGRVRSIGGDVALFAHEYVLRVLAARWIGLPPEEGRRLLFDIGSVSVLSHYRQEPAIRSWNCSG